MQGITFTVYCMQGIFFSCCTQGNFITVFCMQGIFLIIELLLAQVSTPGYTGLVCACPRRELPRAVQRRGPSEQGAARARTRDRALRRHPEWSRV